MLRAISHVSNQWAHVGTECEPARTVVQLLTCCSTLKLLRLSTFLIGFDALHCSQKEHEAKLQALMKTVEQELGAKGATRDVREYVKQVLQAQYARYQEFMTREADMRRELQRYVTTLEVSAGALPRC